MSDRERAEGREPEGEEERLQRPEEEIKDLEPPPEDSEDVQGGLKFEGESKDR